MQYLLPRLALVQAQIHQSQTTVKESTVLPDRPSSAVIDTNETPPPSYFQPKEVWEVSFSDMALSRTHKAACHLLDDPDGRGVSLRFP